MEVDSRRLRVLGTHERRRPEKVAEATARSILVDLEISKKPPGTRLPPEAAMLDMYGVARASLREALRILEIQGVIELRPGPRGGAFVAEATSHEFSRMASLHYHMLGVTIRELVEARLVVEPIMAGLAAERGDEPSRQHVRDVMAASMEMPLDDWQNQRLLGFDFHDAICAMSGNPLLNVVAKSLKDGFSDRVTSHAFTADERMAVLTEHAAVAEAVMDRNPERAEELMREHMKAIVASVEERHPALLNEVVAWR
jgi:GntR family transcriptional repressor for pyruvate dehydrogenase complex